MYVALDQTSVTAYVRQSPLWASLFDQAEDLEGEDLADGNINLVFRVYSRSDRSRSAIIKQALPWSPVAIGDYQTGSAVVAPVSGNNSSVGSHQDRARC